MTSFIFFKVFEPQTVKNSQICIQIVKFKFKRINQKVSPHYRPPTPTAGGNAHLDYNAGATVRSEQAVALPPAHRATSARASDSTSGACATTRH
jgi:hypothetical protein